VSIFKTIEFSEDGTVPFTEFFNWCELYLTYDEDVEVALA
jgi:hypothetical protein